MANKKVNHLLVISVKALTENCIRIYFSKNKCKREKYTADYEKKTFKNVKKCSSCFNN